MGSIFVLFEGMRLPRLSSAVEQQIRVFDPDEVTSREGGQPECDPVDAGMTARDVNAIWDGIRKLYKTGLYPAIGFCMRRRGKVVLDRAIGHTQGNAPTDPLDAHKVQCTPATLHNLFSASKMVTAMLIHLLNERGQVHLDDYVAHYIPEFGTHGKERITVRHVLTHRSGIPRIPEAEINLDLIGDLDRIVELICDAEPITLAGRRLAYHALTGGFVLGEIIRRVTGKDPREFIRDEILGPLGFSHFNFGIPPEDLPNVAQNAFTGTPMLPPAGTIFRRILGVEFMEAVRWSNDPRFLCGIVPAGNIVSTANEASRFMQLLLDGGELDGVRIFESRTITRAVAEQSYLEVDTNLLLPLRYSMGFMLGSKYASFYGLRTSHAFGHLGFTNTLVYADPERDIAVALMTSGKPIMSWGVLRTLGLLQSIAFRCPRDWGHP